VNSSNNYLGKCIVVLLIVVVLLNSYSIVNIMMKIVVVLLLFLLLVQICYSNNNINRLRKPIITSLITSLSSFSLLLLPINTLAISIDPNLSSTQLVQAGMRSFSKGDLGTSVELFDEAKNKMPDLENYLWQRGLSLYYMNEYDKCADQFKRDVIVNKDDTEEAVWNLACQTQSNYEQGKGDKSLDLARKNILTIQNDRRPIMNTVYNVFKGTLPEEKLIEEQGDKDDSSINYFYSKLYQSLFKDIKQDKESGLTLMKEALDSKYAKLSNDYMITLARNAVRLREMEMEQ